VSNGLVSGATFEVQGKIDNTFLQWTMGRAVGNWTPIPNVEIIYSLKLPSGAEYRFKLKGSRNGSGVPTWNDFGAYNDADRQIIQGIQKALDDGSMVEILATTEVLKEMASPNLRPFLSDPSKIQSYQLFHEYETLWQIAVHSRLREKTTNPNRNIADWIYRYSEPEIRSIVTSLYDQYQDTINKSENANLALIKRATFIEDSSNRNLVINMAVVQAMSKDIGRPDGCADGRHFFKSHSFQSHHAQGRFCNFTCKFGG